jgi:hypothetical protein
MQNRYVADIGDYLKFAILRRLAPGRKLGVAWWLFPDEDHNADGRHRTYLERQNEWRKFDPILFDVLVKIAQEQSRDVRAIENSCLLPNAVFASDLVPCDVLPFSQRPESRRRWFEGIKSKVRDCNLVFLDPDNGVAPKGLKLTERRAGKSVTLEEIEALQENGRSLVVYHHQTRVKGGHRFEIRNLSARLRSCGLYISGALRARPWSPRVFFIINGDRELQDRAKSIADVWGHRVEWYSDAELLKYAG